MEKFPQPKDEPKEIQETREMRARRRMDAEHEEALHDEEVRKQAEGLADITSEEWDEYFEDVEAQRLAKKKDSEK